jgi:hypothetical protein
MACTGCSALDDDTQDEDSRVDDDSILARDDLSQETAVQGTSPGAEFEDRGEPALFGTVLDIVAHVIAEGMHGQNAAEDTLIISVQEPTNACETGDTKDAQVSKQACWTASARKGHAVLERSIAELGGFRGWCHVEGLSCKLLT